MPITLISKSSASGQKIACSAEGSFNCDDLSQPQDIRAFHSLGVVVEQIPSSIHFELLDLVRNAISFGSETILEDGGGVIASSRGAAASYIPQAAVLQRAHSAPVFLDLIEKFSGIKAKATECFGPRLYYHGSTLLRHRDRGGTHVFGMTLYIDSSDHKEWPIVFELEHQYAVVKISMGELAIYEGVRLPHFRCEPLAASYFAAAFLHYSPVNDESIR